ncbi:hypothetical protein ASD24_26915 [Paenibacillus sp. Root52]|uniref:serine hydrolase n=1 Tax=Paenibacillus sp. Root52 TaxID=1736552 RepID=UPI000700E7DD|nr:serine hydrolase [Paenibacillus sp. Root52]KQY87109.1 hypothetical protein ASD24_26915 [Paenibacillus sp. Root52]
MSDIQRKIDQVHNALSAFWKGEPVPGLAVGIVYRNQTIYTRGFGIMNMESGLPVTEHTLFHTASVSKTLVATAIMQLAEQGLLQLNGYVTEYLPYFNLKDELYQLITVRHLLNHTSGLPDEDDFGWDRPEYDEGSLERYVRSIGNCTLRSRPGEAFFYSNIGYEILGDLIAKVSGMDFESYMKSHILLPCSMMHSSFLKQEVPADLLADPHILGLFEGYGPEVSLTFPYHRAHAPSSTLYASATDLCAYAVKQLQGLHVDHTSRLLHEENYHAMWGSETVTGYGNWLNTMGLGWFTGEYKGCRTAAHMGRDTGFRSLLVLLPHEGIAVTILMNADYIGLNIVSETLLDILLGMNERATIPQSLAHALAGIALRDGVEEAYQYYADVVLPSIDTYVVYEGEFNAFAYMLLRSERPREGLCILEIAIRLFPESSNLHDSLGEMYAVAGNRDQAIEHYQKSIELDPTNVEATEIIHKLLRQFD